MTLGLYPLILFVGPQIRSRRKKEQVNLFKQIWNRIKEHVREALNSRLFVLIFVFCILFTILIGRLFYLSIVKGNYYLNNYESVNQKNKNNSGTRGNIYDRNGNLLAYNDLAYSENF